MLEVKCGCGNRAYIESMGYRNEDNSLVIIWDTDTMGLEYRDEGKGLRIKCPQCKLEYDILRVV
ncbi:MAG TPA: hypothetical protein VIK72_09385 [Clostridiaceae bacterium]